MGGHANDASPLERELIALVKKTCEQPARLSPSDLDDLREIAGDDTLDYTLVIGSFHFVNRIADLLQVPLEAMPRALRRFEFLRRFNISIASRLLAKMDMDNRQYPYTFEQAYENLAPLVDDSSLGGLSSGFTAFKARPKMLEVLQLILEEKQKRCSLDCKILTKIHQTVEKALPQHADDMQSFHELPADPIECFAFIGTRYAYRTTREMIDRLRQEGYDDISILDLAIAVADTNMWARMFRLFDLNSKLFYEVRK